LEIPKFKLQKEIIYESEIIPEIMADNKKLRWYFCVKSNEPNEVISKIDFTTTLLSNPVTLTGPLYRISGIAPPTLESHIIKARISFEGFGGHPGIEIEHNLLLTTEPLKTCNILKLEHVPEGKIVGAAKQARKARSEVNKNNKKGETKSKENFIQK